MNNTTRYEQLIAEKLEQMPVPDMADSIWAGIEAQLDAVVETTPDQDTSFKWKGKTWFGIAGIAIIASGIWWYSQSATPETPVTTPAPTSTPTPATLSAPAPPTPDSNTIITLPQTPAKHKDTIELPAAPFSNPLTDSVPARYLPLMTPDSVHIPTTIPAKPHQQPDTVVIPPAPKKPKGVKGITSDDYKITVDKDSVNKTH
ncbi:hypothetical protein [Chitinophaga dinghuensis]|uniref:hypothetical protein n=1 Tax=Chitinophaga dinghuensis TaxID=1539050 RepID=UPI0011B948D5|nr:hypothetical protein [Chitinophaga dinghuensis]